MSTSGGSASGTITTITSTGSTLAVVDPTGPTTDLEASLPVVESYITNNVTLTTHGVAYNITSVALGAGTWLVTGRAVLDNPTGTTSLMVIWLASLSASSAGTNYAGTSGYQGNGVASFGSMVKEIVLAAPGTVYLNVLSSAADGCIAEHTDTDLGVPNVSGISAVRIA